MDELSGKMEPLGMFVNSRKTSMSSEVENELREENKTLKAKVFYLEEKCSTLENQVKMKFLSSKKVQITINLK